MEYFLITLAAFGIAVIGLAVGVIFSDKRLKGSCGGLGRIMGKDCEICGKRDECERVGSQPSA